MVFFEYEILYYTVSYKISLCSCESLSLSLCSLSLCALLSLSLCTALSLSLLALSSTQWYISNLWFRIAIYYFYFSWLLFMIISIFISISSYDLVVWKFNSIISFIFFWFEFKLTFIEFSYVLLWAQLQRAVLFSTQQKYCTFSY